MTTSARLRALLSMLAWGDAEHDEVAEALGAYAAILDQHVHISTGGRDPNEKIYSKRDVQALIAVTIALKRHKQSPDGDDRLKRIIDAYDAYRGRGVMPAPGEYADLVAAINEARDPAPPRGGEQCQHDLLKPGTTIEVIDPWKAKCKVCIEFFDLPGRPPLEPAQHRKWPGEPPHCPTCACDVCICTSERGIEPTCPVHRDGLEGRTVQPYCWASSDEGILPDQGWMVVMPTKKDDYTVPLFLHAAPRGGERVRLPTSADEAELMAKLGMLYLEQNAPERLKKPVQQAKPLNVADLTTDERRAQFAIERIRNVLDDDHNYEAASLKLGGIWNWCDITATYRRFGSTIGSAIEVKINPKWEASTKEFSHGT